MFPDGGTRAPLCNSLVVRGLPALATPRHDIIRRRRGPPQPPTVPQSIPRQDRDEAGAKYLMRVWYTSPAAFPPSSKTTVRPSYIMFGHHEKEELWLRVTIVAKSSIQAKESATKRTGCVLHALAYMSSSRSADIVVNTRRFSVKRASTQ